MIKRSSLAFAFFAALAAGCASSPRPQAEAAPPRVKDSATDKVAAQRAANPELGLEAEDERWGISAAAEREADRKARKPPAGTNASGTGRVDVTPPAPPAPTK